MPSEKRYNTDLMKDDMNERGWMPADLFAYAGVTKSRGYQFLRDVCQTARTAESLTRALGKPQGYYLIRRVRRPRPRPAQESEARP